MSADTPIRTSPSTIRSLWQEYRLFADRLELDTHFGVLKVPFDTIEHVEISDSDVSRALRGDLQLKGFRPALKVDWANFTEHVKVDRSTGWLRRILFTPADPEAFGTALQAALDTFRHRRAERS